MIIDSFKAIELLKTGQLVAVPTETVYGLAGDASSDEAVLKIYETKNRPNFNPLIIHVSNIDQALEYAEFTEEAKILAKEFWPGPLTLVLKRKENSLISKHALAGLKTIAIRIPANSTTLEIIRLFGKPIAAPSANLSSQISPTRASHVSKSLGDKVYIIDGGKSTFGLESTILNCSLEGKIEILRHGYLTREILEEFLKTNISEPNTAIIKAPGMLKKHYSPSCKLRINSQNILPNEVAINFGESNLSGAKTLNLSEKGDLIEAAANLYDLMQLAEDYVKKFNLSGIAVAPLPNKSIGVAINDKLNRAIS
jgi:L-threonylcarbamoyladenylate synthase